MSPTAVGLAAAAATAFPLLLWAIGRIVTDGGDELLVILTTQTTGDPQATRPLGKVFRVTASECSLARVRRWRDEGILLRAYLSHGGALMLADPALGGNAACEPATTVDLAGPQAGAPSAPVTT